MSEMRNIPPDANIIETRTMNSVYKLQKVPSGLAAPIEQIKQKNQKERKESEEDTDLTQTRDLPENRNKSVSIHDLFNHQDQTQLKELLDVYPRTIHDKEGTTTRVFPVYWENCQGNHSPDKQEG